MTAFALPELDTLVRDLKDNVLKRWSRAAVRASLLEFRDRDQAPGVKARFSAAAYKPPYDFADRFSRKGKDFAPDASIVPYVRTGAMRSTILKRAPRIKNGTAEVVGRFSLWAPALAFLAKRKGIERTVKTERMESVQIKATTRKHPKTGAVHAVAAYTAVRRIRTFTRTYRTQTMAQEWGLRGFEQDSIARRSDELLRDIYRRSAVTKGGRIRKSVLKGEIA